MKTAIGIGVLLVTLSVAGCTTSPTERQENVDEELTGVKNEMVETRERIAQTLTSLDALLRASADDLPDAYERYADNVNELKDSSEAIDKNAAQLREQRGQWLTEWEDSGDDVQNRELREVSQERRALMASRFETADEALAAARAAYSPLVQNLDDVRVVIGHDLTPGGVAAIGNTETVDNAMAYGEEVEENLEGSIGAIDELLEVLNSD